MNLEAVGTFGDCQGCFDDVAVLHIGHLCGRIPIVELALDVNLRIGGVTMSHRKLLGGGIEAESIFTACGFKGTFFADRRIKGPACVTCSVADSTCI